MVKYMENEKIRFCLDRENMTITFYFTEKQMKEYARLSVKENIDVGKVSDVLSELCAEVTKEICKMAHLDFDKMLPLVEIV